MNLIKHEVINKLKKFNDLKNVDPTDLMLAQRVLVRTQRSKIGIGDAIKYEQFARGDKVTFNLKNGSFRRGEVKKINKSTITVLDLASKQDLLLKPEDLTMLDERNRRKVEKNTLKAAA